MDTNEKKLRNKITIISFICSIMVIYIHSNNINSYGLSNDSVGIGGLTYSFETYCGNICNSIAVPMFFVISGFLFFRNFTMDKLFKKWRNRLKSLVLPYVIWCSLYYFYFVLVTNIPQIRNIMNGGINSGISLDFATWIKWLWPEKYYTLWFLQNLIVYIVLTPLIWIVLKNNTKLKINGLIALIIIELVLYFDLFNLPYSNGLSFYLFGCYLGINCRNHMYFNNSKVSTVASIYAAIYILLGLPCWNFYSGLLLFASIWFILDIFVSSETYYPWWMSITFFTYVSHDLLLEIYKKIYIIVTQHNIYGAVVAYVLMPVLTEITLILVAYLMNKHAAKVWLIITGNRGGKK